MNKSKWYHFSILQHRTESTSIYLEAWELLNNCFSLPSSRPLATPLTKFKIYGYNLSSHHNPGFYKAFKIIVLTVGLSYFGIS